MPVYAVSADLTATYPNVAHPLNVDLLLKVASNVVDRCLVGVVYDVDTDKAPTDSDVAETLKQATCAIVAEWITLAATDPGGTQQWESISIGSLSLQTLQGASATDTPRVNGLPVPALALSLLSTVGVLTVWGIL